LFDNKDATMTQAFGPEARGSACSAQLIISDDAILYPYVTQARTLIAMSQDAFNKFSPEMAENGTLLIEEELVKVGKVPKGVKVYGIPATRIAEELGRKMVLNIVMVGFFSAIAKFINPKAVRRAVQESVPKGTETLNLAAFDRGYEYGQNLLSKN